MRRSVALKLVSILQIVLLACAGLFPAPVRVKAQTPGGSQLPCPPNCDWACLLFGACGGSGSGNRSNQSPRGVFRVTLNGFRVNHESDDDILEGDGRGDEIFITSYLWGVFRDGTARPVTGVQTSVMGDVRGHPQRVLAGSGTRNSNRMDGGLRTDDTFPACPAGVIACEPWRRNGEPPRISDRPPIILWQGPLTKDQDAVVILPIVWEWDSPDRSESQRSLERGIGQWFENEKVAVVKAITHALSSPVVQSVSLPRQTTLVLNPPPNGLYTIDPLPLGGKAGTRPIGYQDTLHNGTSDWFAPIQLVLTYDSAVLAAQTTNFSVRGVFEIRYADANDHGDYSLFLQVEQIVDPLYHRETTPVRPRP